VLLISVLKKDLGLIFVYTVSGKLVLTGKLTIRTYRPYIQILIDKQFAHTIAEGSI